MNKIGMEAKMEKGTAELIGSYRMTPGYRDISSTSAQATAWGMRAVKTMMAAKAKAGEGEGLPSMVVGEPGGKAIRTEDGERTMIVPIPWNLPKLYACDNGEGGVTLMLADEY